MFSAQKKKTLLRYVFVLCLLFFLPAPGSAADLSPGYSESVQLAIDHAANPAGWTKSSLILIPDTTVGAAAGLVYDGGSLIVRTVTKAKNFKWNYVGEAGYKIYGGATTAKFGISGKALRTAGRSRLSKALPMQTAGARDGNRCS